MTDKQKASELTLKLEGEIGTSPHSRQAIEEAFIEMAEWKDKQYPHWNKQEENDIYFTIDDWDLHIFVCIMKDSKVCTWTGIKDESADGYIETHLVPDKSQYTIDNIVYWTEVKKI